MNVSIKASRINYLHKIVLSFLMYLLLGCTEKPNQMERDIMNDVNHSWNRIFMFWRNDTFEDAIERERNIQIDFGEPAEIDLDTFEYIKTFAKVRNKCQGASQQELDFLQKQIDVNLDKALLGSLSICAHPDTLDGDRYEWLGDINRLLTINEIVEEYNMFRKFDLQSPDDASRHQYFQIFDGVVAPASMWPKEWIPIFDWDTSYKGVLDMREDIGDQKGQILLIAVEGGIIARWADSYEGFLSMAADSVEKYGEMRIQDIEQTLRLGD